MRYMRQSSLIRKFIPAVLAMTITGTEACRTQSPEDVTRNVIRQDIRAVFPDVPSSHPQFEAIQFLGRQRIMTALADGRFHPEQGMPRGQALRLFLDTAGVRDIPTVTENPFPDVPAAHPLAGYVLRAVQLGVIRGYDAGNLQGRFAIDRIVSVIEALKMMLLSFHVPADQLHNIPSYTDVPAGVWYVPFARYAMEHHLIEAQPDGSIGRDHPLTRGEIADLLYRFLRDRPDLLPAFIQSL